MNAAASVFLSIVLLSIFCLLAGILLFAGDAFETHCHEVAACPSGREVAGDAESGELVNGALAGVEAGETVVRGTRVSLTIRHLLEFLLTST